MFVGAGLLQLLVGGRLLLLSSDGTRTSALLRLRHRDDFLESVLRHVLKLGAWGVALSHLLSTGLLREEQQLGHVELQALHVGLEALRASIPAAVVDGNADGLRVLLGDLGLPCMRLKFNLHHKPELQIRTPQPSAPNPTHSTLNPLLHPTILNPFAAPMPS